MDALFSERMGPWTSLGFGMDALFSERMRPWTSLGFGHGCSVVKTE